MVLPTATPAPSPSARPTATLAPALPLRITAQLDPPTPRAGAEFVLRLVVTNDGNHDARGAYIATSGPWDKWTIVDMTDGADLARDAAGWRIISSAPVSAHGSATIEIHLRADAPTEDQLTFAVREAEPGELR